MSPLCGCSSPTSPAASLPRSQLCVQSQDPPQGVGSHSICLGFLPAVLHAPGSQHLHGNATSAMTYLLTPLLHCLYTITSSLGSLNPALWVCLSIGFFAMLGQSNLAPPSASQFNLTRHTCRGWGTFSWLLQAYRFWYGGPRHISRSVEHRCYPSRKSWDTTQT